MKKNIFIAAAVAMLLGMTACQKEEIVPGNNPVNPGTDVPANNARVKSTADLHNTDWTYTVTYSEFLYNVLGADVSCVPGFEDDTMSFGLNFDGTYAHFTFPTNIEAYNVDTTGMQQIAGVSYTYSYNGVTHIGYLDGVTDDNDTTQLQFTYTDSTDIITFNLPMFFAEDSTAFTLTLNFVRNEE